MNVLATLSQVLSRNGIKSPHLRHEKFLLSMFETATRPNKPETPEKGVKPEIPEGRAKPEMLGGRLKSQIPEGTMKRAKKVRKEVKTLPKTLSEDEIRAVGMGSNFQKKAVKEYLSPLQTHDFSRHDIRDDYDAKKASRMHQNAKRATKSKDSQHILFSSSRQFVGDLLGALVACSSKQIEASSEKVVRCFPKWTFDEIPRIPNFSANPTLFEDYIGILTHTNFLYKNSSSTSGAVPMILRNLMHPANLKTLYLRTTRTYNDLIYYFCEKFDFASCREIFAQMRIEGVPRNSITYNLMLRSVLKNSHIRKSKPIDGEVLYYLRNMAKNQIEADAVTWATCYNFLNEDVSRSIYVEKMQEREVPLTGDFIYTVLRNGPYSSKECLQFLAQNKVPLNSKLFKLSIDRLLQEDRANVAWLFLEHTVLKKDKGFMIGNVTLNAFLRHFASKGRLDMAIATFNTCVQDYHMRPDNHTFEMLFKALAANGYTKNFSLVLEFLKELRKECKLGERNNYWLVRASAISRFNVRRSNTFAQGKKDETKALLNRLKWSLTSSGFTTKMWKENGPPVRTICRFLGCIPKPLKTDPPVNAEAAAAARTKKQRYRRRIRCIAIHGAMRKRVPFSEDWYGSLRHELEQRNVIDQSSRTL